MTSIFRVAFMALFLVTGINTIRCVYILLMPGPIAPTPRVIAATRKVSQAPSEVNRKELALAIAEWEEANRKGQTILVAAIGAQAIALLALGREINRLHETP